MGEEISIEELLLADIRNATDISARGMAVNTYREYLLALTVKKN